MARARAALLCPQPDDADDAVQDAFLQAFLALDRLRDPDRFAGWLGVIPKARRHGLRLLVTPDTILRWHRDIVRRRWAARSTRGKTGRPATRRNVTALVLRLARENPNGLPQDPRRTGRPGSENSGVDGAGILKKAGIDPAPRRTGLAWSQFLRSQAGAILACDFFTAGLLDGTQAYVLAVIEHATRRIRILGVTLHPTGEWSTQQACNLIMDLGEQTHRVKFMVRDRGSNFTAAFDAVLADAGIRTVLCNVQTRGRGPGALYTGAVPMLCTRGWAKSHWGGHGAAVTARWPGSGCVGSSPPVPAGGRRRDAEAAR
jgi:hypothetical protein